MKMHLNRRRKALFKEHTGPDRLTGENSLEYPLLADLFSIEQLEKHGEAIARLHELDFRAGKDKLLGRLTENEKILSEIYEFLSTGEEAKQSLSTAGVWLLDNFFLIEEQIQIARKHLPKRYSQELPRLRSGPSAGLPRVYDIVRELISHVDGKVDKGNLGSITASYQRITPLKLGELWAIPIMLRLALIENLRRVAMRVAAGMSDRNLAGIWADRLLKTAGNDPKNIILDMADMVRAELPMTSTFVAELVRRLQSRNPALVLPLTWIEQRLIEKGQTIERLVQLDSQHQATSQISISNSINSLRFLTAINWKNFVEAMSRVEQVLRGDPAGVYQKMDFTTRDNYRHVIEKIAKQSRLPEDSVALQAVKLSSQNKEKTDKTAHIGYYLIGRGRNLLEQAVKMRLTFRDKLSGTGRKAPLFFYLGSILLVTAGLTLSSLRIMHPPGPGIKPWLAFLLLLGFSQLSIALVNWVSSILVKPVLLPRMDFSKGVPQESCTLITVPSILSSAFDIGELMNKIETCCLANRADNLYFSLLTDFKDAPEESMPDDGPLFKLAREGIKQLNNKYGRNGRGPFYLFHRSRLWNPGEKVWMGYERKRGKLEALNKALRSGKTPELLIEGDPSVLPQVKYVITLDTDTQLPRDAARLLIETMAHPLNVPVYDPAKKRVVSGYTILQPRVVSSLPAARKSWYSRIFGSETGIDPYTRAVSDVYQDIFGEGSFIGKGIYDVDMFIRSLADRLPENRILSHDLLESTYGRSGMISDVQLIDEFPESYSEDISRRRRWIRGDWQIAAWLLPRVPGYKQKPEKNPISLLSWWKIFDNLRRSLVPAGLMLLIVLSWMFLQPSWLGFSIAAGIIFIPMLPGVFKQAFRIPVKFPLTLHMLSVAGYLGRHLFQAVFLFAVLPYEAFFNLIAIIITCSRMLFSRRKLLEWTPSGEARHKPCRNLPGYYRLMAIVPLLILVFGTFLFTQWQEWILNILGLTLFWFFSPFFAWWISRPLVKRSISLSPKQITFLRKICRKTWRFFETFAGPEDNWLPADNYQEEPKEASAHRTSPTNIGLMLLSNLGAYDLGYQSAGQLIDRTRKSFRTMEGLARFHGHFFNWYDTRTLQPLPPEYVSTVDSGNLAGYLLTLRPGLLELKDRKIFQQQLYSGLIDALSVINDLLIPPPDKITMILKKKSALDKRLSQLIETITDMRLQTGGLGKALEDLNRIVIEVRELRILAGEKPDPEADWWFQALEDQCAAEQEELIFLAPWLVSEGPGNTINKKIIQDLDNNRTLSQLAGLNELSASIEAGIKKSGPSSEEKREPDLEFYDKLLYKVRQGSHRAQARIKQLEQMALQCRDLSDQDYDFLYDASRNLLSIGYDVSKHRNDESFYDLLASEARLCSFIGIARGKLPLEHWFSLGRLVTIWKGRTILLSWGGSMFEYLMPRLVMPDYDNTLLGQSCQAVVERQIAYGRKKGVPWGISESAEAMTDAGLNYQYRSFGVPDIGFKRGLSNDLVIAPYASVLAMMLNPGEACVNLQKLSERGFEGRYGFYEAIDFTPGRLPHDQSEVLIRSFMAHHQGMSFISLVNYFTNDLMINRFTSDPLFQTTVLLLQERVPKATPFQMLPSVLSRTRDMPEKQEDALRVFNTAGTPFPEVHLLSNGRYHVMVTNAGGGYSRWRDIAVTRWSEDATRDNFGTFIYINDISSGSLWSAAFQPTLAEPKNYEALFPQARAEFRRRDQGLDTYTEIAVSPEDDIEHRRISLSNYTVKTRTIEITSYAEVVLIKPDDETAHPAFSNLFMQTGIIREHKAILCSRRPRSPHEKNPWMFHLLAVNENEQFEVSYETDRLKFIGRGRAACNPLAMEEAGPLSGTEGPVLDPAVSIRCRLTLKPGDTVTVGFISGMAETQQEAMTLIEKYQDRRLADRVFDMALIHGKVLLQQLNASESDAQVYGRLASSILYSNLNRRANPAILMKNKKGQSGLWAYSISGDLPIVLLRISDKTKIELAAKMIQAHTYWHSKGLQVDLVIWNEDWSGYRQALNDLITGLISAGPEASAYDRPGGIFLRHPDQMPEEDRILMQSAARLIITDSGGTLAEQSQRSAYSGINIPKLAASRDKRPFTGIENFRQDNLLFFNGIGGFTRDGREYIIQIKPGETPPMPWVNILSNKNFGSVILQSGGYTWYENSHNFRLTPWYNDPVSESSGEALYIRDEASGSFWSPMPLPAPGSSDYLNRHGFGYSVFEYSLYDLKSELWIYVDINAPVKFWMLKVRNDSNGIRRLSSTIFLELVLGEIRSRNQMHIRTEIDPMTGAVFAANPYSVEFSGRVMFLGTNEVNRSITGDRTEFIGRNGSLADPQAMHKVRLSGRTGGGLDPAAAIQVYFELEPGQEKEIVFILGVGRDIEDAQNLVQRYNGSLPAYQARERVWEYWKHTLGTINIETPDTALNLITNGWLMYQIMASRLWARSGFYQSGGAFGFRDQLQDVMALVHAEPGLFREHLLLCASRQFREGDVQHWWHPPQGRGVRTRISDDFLWMPFAAGAYITRTGDTGILDEIVPFLEGRPLNAGEESYYDMPLRSEENAPFYEHCKRAVMHAFRFGQHGLPLMGGGDWNDGMNLVGAEGRGESVWLAFFLYHILEEFGPLARLHGDEPFAKQCAEEAGKLMNNIESHAWDGKWYRRAYFDDGAPLGSLQNQECRIDAVAQSWSVLSGASSPKRARQAMQSLEHRLVRPKSGLILLLDPPFDKSNQEPGYIKGYVPGIRENGGQYTHAAVWAVMAFAKMGENEKVKKLLAMINPVNHGSTREKIEIYKVEPYVMSADIYGTEPHTGRGGWTWYTGSASWMYRLIIESVFGLDLKVNKLYFKPCIPEDWEYFKVHYRFRETVYHMDFHQIKPGGDIHVAVDGAEQPDPSITLTDDRLEHFAEILIGG